VTLNLHPPRNVARRNLLAIYVGAFFAALGLSFVTPLMPLLTLELLEGDLARVGLWVGIAIGISPLLTALTGPWWGALGDRVGQKKMIQRALISIGPAIAVMALISHPWQLVGLRGVIGVLGGISVACLAAITATSSRPLLGRNIGFLQAAQTLGQVAGPMVGGGLALAAGMRPAFLISALLFVLAFGLDTWLYRDVPKAAPRPIEQKAAEAAPANPPLARSFRFWAILGALFSANFLDGSFMVMLPLYLPILGAPGESLALLAGLGLSGGALAMALSATLAGRLTSRFPSGRLILAMLGGALLALLGIALAAAWWQFLALRVVLGLVAGGLPTVAYTATASLVPAAQSGRTVGLASSAGLLGWAVAPFLVGLLVGAHPRAVFAMDLLLVFACVAALCWAGGRPGRYGLPGFARAPLSS
jgi:DHA1 family multidrug resistance protein-like MFS transporter